MIELLSLSTFSFPKMAERKNEDAVLAPVKKGSGYLFAVADGVGSYAGADLASRAAIETIDSLNPEVWDDDESSDFIFEEIKRRISSLSSIDDGYSKAATTLTFCHVGKGRLRIGHVGDCRAYFREGGRLKQITEDHTQYQRLINEGMYKPSELKKLPGNNSLFSAISRNINLVYQASIIPLADLCEEDGSIDIFIMSDGAYSAWEHRPRFSRGTMENPNRFASNLHRRITRLMPSDDHSLIAVKLGGCYVNWAE